MHTNTITIRRGRRMAAGIAAGAMVLLAAALPATLAHADVDGEIRGSVEVTLSRSVTVYAEPDPESAVVTVLPPGTTVDKIGQQIGADRQMWVQVAGPDGVALGWIPLTDFTNGSASAGVLSDGFDSPAPAVAFAP